MATVIKIKSASTANEPGGDVLAQAEQAYSYASDKLFIGKSESDGQGGTQINPIVIGGKKYVDMLDHTAGTTTSDSALIVDSNSRLDELTIGAAAANLFYHDAEIAAKSTEADLSITLTPKGTGVVNVPDGYKDRAGFSDDSLVTKEYVDGVTANLSVSLSVGADSGTDDVVTVGTDTLLFAGGTGIGTTVSDNQISIAIDSTVATLAGSETFTNKTLTSPTVSGLTLSDSSIVFEGDTADDFETTLTVTDPTADRTITFKDGTGTVAFTSDIPTNNNELTNGAGYITGYTVTSGDVTAHEGDLSIGGSQLDDASVANVKLANDGITIGSTDVSLGDTITDINALTSLDVDNITIDGNDISTTNTDGNLTLSPNGEGVVKLPSSYESRDNFDADSLVPKSYVDAIAEGLHVHASVKAATTGTLTSLISDGTVTYDNGTEDDGVGATLTLATALGTLDGYTLVDGDRVLIKDEASQAHNGIYIRTNSTTFTRATDFDTTAEVASGDFLFVENGTVNGSNGYVQTETTSTIGTDNIIFEQFSGAGQITAGSALTKSGNQLDVNVDNSSIEIASDALQVKALGVTNAMIAASTIDLTAKVTGTLPVGNGGTGLATVTSNGVVYGNGASAVGVTAASTAAGAILQTATSGGAPAFSNIIDGGSFDA